MHAAAKQILTAYEGGLTPEEIAWDLGLEVETVKLSLSQTSVRYRKLLKEAEAGNKEIVSKDEGQEMLGILMRIARDQELENPGVSFKAAKYVLEESMGRNHRRVNEVGNGGININIFNDNLAKARNRALVLKAKAGLIEDSKPKAEEAKVEEETVLVDV